MNQKNVFGLPTESALSFHLRTRILPAAIYLTAGAMLLLLSKVIGV